MGKMLYLFPLLIFLYACTDVQTQEELFNLRKENKLLRAQLDSLKKDDPAQLYAQAIEKYKSKEPEQALTLLESLKEHFPQWEPGQVNKKILDISAERKKEEEEKKKFEAALDKYVKKSYDNFEKITWYETTRNTTKQIDGNKKFTVELYFGIEETGRRVFRLRTKYLDERTDDHTEDWIFYRSVQLLGDDGTQLEVDTKYPSKKTDNGNYGLEEWSDNYVDSETIVKFANCKKIDVRFSGKYSYDFQMTPAQLSALKEIVEKAKRLE